jgi:hypothetical protein
MIGMRWTPPVVCAIMHSFRVIIQCAPHFSKMLALITSKWLTLGLIGMPLPHSDNSEDTRIMVPRKLM